MFFIADGCQHVCPAEVFARIAASLCGLPFRYVHPLQHAYIFNRGLARPRYARFGFCTHPSRLRPVGKGCQIGRYDLRLPNHQASQRLLHLGHQDNRLQLHAVSSQSRCRSPVCRRLPSGRSWRHALLQHPRHTPPHPPRPHQTKPHEVHQGTAEGTPHQLWRDFGPHYRWLGRPLVTHFLRRNTIPGNLRIHQEPAAQLPRHGPQCSQVSPRGIVLHRHQIV